MTQPNQPRPPRLVWAGQARAYLLPPVDLPVRVTYPHGELPYRIRLRLEDGTPVDLPFEQETFEKFVSLCASVKTTFPKVPRQTWGARLRLAWLNLGAVERAACILAAALLFFGIEIGGFYTVATDAKGITYIVNRFTGGVGYCVGGTCH